MARIATIEDPQIARRILGHLGISTAFPQPPLGVRSREPPDLPGDVPT
jgi:hypothetical protein